MKEKTKPTFSILCDTEENTNLAINEVIKISLEEGVVDQVFLDSLNKLKKAEIRAEKEGWIDIEDVEKDLGLADED